MIPINTRDESNDNLANTPQSPRYHQFPAMLTDYQWSTNEILVKISNWNVLKQQGTHTSRMNCGIREEDVAKILMVSLTVFILLTTVFLKSVQETMPVSVLFSGRKPVTPHIVEMA